jgi:hypothetical protein
MEFLKIVLRAPRGSTAYTLLYSLSLQIPIPWDSYPSLKHLVHALIAILHRLIAFHNKHDVYQFFVELSEWRDIPWGNLYSDES